MNIVIVKHESCGNKYLFRVPEDAYLKAGELVRVKTKRGFTIATCMCDSFEVADESQELNAICMAFNATLPLAPVVGQYDYYDFRMDEDEKMADSK